MIVDIRRLLSISAGALITLHKTNVVEPRVAAERYRPQWASHSKMGINHRFVLKPAKQSFQCPKCDELLPRFMLEFCFSRASSKHPKSSPRQVTA
jgi:hypothetical protein